MEIITCLLLVAIGGVIGWKYRVYQEQALWVGGGWVEVSCDPDDDDDDIDTDIWTDPGVSELIARHGRDDFSKG